MIAVCAVQAECRPMLDFRFIGACARFTSAIRAQQIVVLAAIVISDQQYG
jgi:hypothetical protein